MGELYKDSNGNEPHYPRHYRQSEKKLKRKQHKLLLMQKDPKNREKQRQRIAKRHQKVANQRKDFLHNKADSHTITCVLKTLI